VHFLKAKPTVTGHFLLPDICRQKKEKKNSMEIMKRFTGMLKTVCAGLQMKKKINEQTN